MQILEPPKLESITPYCRAGGSDKIYLCAIEAAGGRFTVNLAHGGRGSTLNTGTKTNVPVEYDNARRTDVGNPVGEAGFAFVYLSAS